MSTYLQVENLARSYGEKNLFSDLSFFLNQDQKVALIARNGAGKSTLLNIIAGVEKADAGTVYFHPGVSMQYLRQDPVLDDLNTVFNEVYSSSNEIQKVIFDYEKAILTENHEEIQRSMEMMDAHKGWDYESRIRQILTQLKITDLDQRISDLSGGQRKRVALAKILITEPDFLLMDEPTNHLDIEMIEWLEEYFNKPGITLLMVTHDRYFLDRVCNEIIELDNGSLFRYKGNYSYFLEKQLERKENLTREREKAQNLLRTEQEWMRRMPKARGTKAKARISSFYDIKETAENRPREDNLKLDIKGTWMGKKILEINDISFNWDELKVLEDFSYIFKRNEKIGIVGKNGTGKSTFLNLITEKIRPKSGKIEVGESIRFGFYEQQGISFNEQTTVLDSVREIAEAVKLGNGRIVSAAEFLNYFMFPFPKQHQLVSSLSGGEKRRLYLVTVLMQSPNFLILDEPTNDLDILTLNVLEEYLATFKGCVIVVTHDRYFLDKIVDHLFVFEGNGKIRDFPGNYTQYKDNLDLRKRTMPLSSRPKAGKTASPRVRNPNKLSYKEKVEKEKLGEEIEQLDLEKAAIEAELHSGNLSPEELIRRSERFAVLLREIEQKTDRWLELSEKDGS
jgi:ABC transport system ATP-binding/permease protein